jgi:hypothetical protein
VHRELAVALGIEVQGRGRGAHEVDGPGRQHDRAVGRTVTLTAPDADDDDAEPPVPTW